MYSAATMVSYSRPSVRLSVPGTQHAYSPMYFSKTYSRCLCCVVGVCARRRQLFQCAPTIPGSSSCYGGGVLLALSGAICRSRTVDASERESSVTTVFFAGGIAARFLSLVNKRVDFLFPGATTVQIEWPDNNARSMSVWSGISQVRAECRSLSVETAAAKFTDL
jgi:hypothetical protein